MRVTILGAAGGEVTGSAYLLETPRARVLVDAGLFQGGGEAEALNRDHDGLEVAGLDAVVLTHAHLDHTGRLPLLIRKGYRGPVYCTEATGELAQIILKDSAKLQVQDAIRTNRKRERAGEEPIAPLYEPADVEPLADLLRPAALHVRVEVAPGVGVRLFEAGHLLGSTSVQVTVDSGDGERVLVFSGDLGPVDLPILREYESFSRADVVFMESTYGDRDHRPYGATVEEFTGIVDRVSKAGGKILVPTFAVGRGQQILYHLAVLFRSGRVKAFPVILDSPMAVEATRVYLRHPELFDEDMRGLRARDTDPFDARHFRASITADDSRKLNEMEGPCAILAGAGMCTAGRIQHHLKQNLWKRGTHVLIVGYQGRGTLGRRLVEGEKEVFIHGEKIAVRAEIHTLGGFSAHAGQSDLLRWFGTLAPSRPRVFLTHGEDRPRAALAEKIRERFGLESGLPSIGEQVAI